MNTAAFAILLYCGIWPSTAFFLDVYPKWKQEEIVGDPGQPLILTPLIKEGKIQEARKSSEVVYEPMKAVKSFSGYLTVNEQFNSNLFFWFFPSTVDYKNDPVVLWLTGGPGVSSLVALFGENGPFMVTPEGEMELREVSWTKGHSMIYIDNPVGTGYSFTNDDGYSKNETVIGENLYNALLQFFQLFPELQKNDFFVTGESYGGKYVPAVSYAIHKNNPKAGQKINLKGLAIGNGWTDPEHQLNYGDYLYQLGLIDFNTRLACKDIEKQETAYIQSEQWESASIANENLWSTCLNVPVSLYNYVALSDPLQVLVYVGKYVQREDVRRAIHVGNATLHGASEVRSHLGIDWLISVAPWVSELLSHYPVMTYNGQLDIIVAYPVTVNYLQNLNFSAADEYKTAQRQIWRVGNDVAGYVKQAGNLTEVLVRNAGHMVPSDQPRWALDLITRFTRNKPFSN